MSRLTKAQLETNWQAGEVHGVGYPVSGEANVEDLLDSAVLYDDALVLEENVHYGFATLSSGEVVVSSAAVLDTSYIYLTINTPGGTVGSPYVYARSAGVSFTIRSTSGSDSSVVAWLMIDPNF
jgi:hypothetical protein